jgi:hypothetical protein
MTDHEKDKFSDSAGVPWEGRSFSENPYAQDDGLADSTLIAAIAAFQSRIGSLELVMTAFAEARLLIPLMANLGESGEGEHGLTVDKSAELSIVTVRTPDGQNGLPVFSSVESMKVWNPEARPVPNHGRAVALAAASEGNTRIVLDPMSPSEIVITRPAIAAIAQGLPWSHPAESPRVTELVAEVLSNLSQVDSFSLETGDPDSRLLGQELVISIYLEPGMADEDLKLLEQQLFMGLSESSDFVELVDSVAVRYLPAS